MNKDITTIQCTQFILSYTVPISEENFLEALKSQINKESRYQTLMIYKSNTFLSTEKQLIPFENSPCEYYYFRFTFNSRQKLTQSKTYLNIIAPKYYVYKNDDLFIAPTLFQRAFDNNTVDRLKKRASEGLIEVLGEYSSNTLRLSESLNKDSNENFLEDHFYKLCKTRDLQEFYQYIEDNNLYFYVDSLVKKMKILFDLQKKLNKPLTTNKNLINPLSEKELLENSQALNLPKLEDNFVSQMESFLNLEENTNSTITQGIIFSNEEIYKVLNEDNYSNKNVCYYIFDSKNLNEDLRIKEIVLNLYKAKKKLNRNSTALYFLCVYYKIVSNPYRPRKANNFLKEPFEYMSEDLKNTYKKYLKNKE